MPSPKYKLRPDAFTFSHMLSIHFELGHCLISGKGRGCCCGLINEDGTFVAEVAAHLWSVHRGAVLAERSKRPFPCFGQVLFDATPLPQPLAAWSASDRGSYAIMVEELARVRAPG